MKVMLYHDGTPLELQVMLLCLLLTVLVFTDYSFFFFSNQFIIVRLLILGLLGGILNGIYVLRIK